MSVYVDNMQTSLRTKCWPYKEHCHLVADSVEELHEFATMIGLKKGWFQPKTLPHYDLTQNKRRQAIRYGAIEIGARELVERIREYRKEQQT